MQVAPRPSFKAVIIEPSFVENMKNTDIPKLEKLFNFMKKNKKNDFFVDGLPDRSVRISIMKANPLMGYMDKDLFTLNPQDKALVEGLQKIEEIYKDTHNIQDVLYEGYVHPDLFTPKKMIGLIKKAMNDFNKEFNIDRFLN